MNDISIDAHREDFVQLDLYEADGSTSAIVIHGPNTTAGMEGVLVSAVHHYVHNQSPRHLHLDDNNPGEYRATSGTTSQEATVAIGTVSASASITVTVGTMTLTSEDICKAVSAYIIETLTLLADRAATTPLTS